MRNIFRLIKHGKVDVTDTAAYCNNPIACYLRGFFRINKLELAIGFLVFDCLHTYRRCQLGWFLETVKSR